MDQTGSSAAKQSRRGKALDQERALLLNALVDEFREIGAERNINGRPMHVFQTKKIADIDRPHAVFVRRHAEKHLPVLARMAAEHSFLVVTESEAGLLDGSTRNLRLVEGRTGFGVPLVTAAVQLEAEHPARGAYLARRALSTD